MLVSLILPDCEIYSRNWKEWPLVEECGMFIPASVMVFCHVECEAVYPCASFAPRLEQVCEPAIIICHTTADNIPLCINTKWHTMTVIFQCNPYVGSWSPNAGIQNMGSYR
jgi:hypothetical protein